MPKITNHELETVMRTALEDRRATIETFATLEEWRDFRCHLIENMFDSYQFGELSLYDFEKWVRSTLEEIADGWYGLEWPHKFDFRL